MKTNPLLPPPPRAAPLMDRGSGFGASRRLAISVRPALASDNAALLALAAQCPMAGKLTISIERDPDFFALNRLEGESWRVAVAHTTDGQLAGCAAAALRHVHLGGVPRRIAYASDFKIHPAHRGGGAAHALLRWGREVCLGWGGEGLPLLATILAGNRAMERLTGGRGFRGWTRFATIRAHAIPLFVPRQPADAGLSIRWATTHDLDEMMALWRETAPAREFSPVFDRPSFSAWLQTAGLRIGDYLLALGPDGRVAGFIGVWDQRALKRLRLHAGGRRLAIIRAGLNVMASLTRGPRLPGPGSILNSATIVHPCIAGAGPAVLHALLRRAYEALRARGCACFTLSLDVRDPLSAAVRGLLSQPTEVHAYIATAGGPWNGCLPASRPLYYDVALT